MLPFPTKIAGLSGTHRALTIAADLVHGEVAYILPCLGRIEIDLQATGPQTVAMEDSTSCFHGSRGRTEPVGPHVRSEPWIVAEMANYGHRCSRLLDRGFRLGEFGLLRTARCDQDGDLLPLQCHDNPSAIFDVSEGEQTVARAVPARSPDGRDFKGAGPKGAQRNGHAGGTFPRVFEDPVMIPRPAAGAVEKPPMMLAVPRLDVRAGSAAQGSRVLAEECPVALTFNGSAHAVLMATPSDPEDFAIGFSLTEGIIDRIGDLQDVETVQHDEAYDVRCWVSDEAAAKLASRRRHLLGPVGCGLCGIESIEEALNPARRVPETSQTIPAGDVGRGLRALEAGQDLNRRTRSHHAAALWDGRRLVVREDIGRHNALDKLAGALIGEPVALTGAMVIVTSRASVDLVQKAARIGVSVLVAVSARRRSRCGRRPRAD